MLASHRWLSELSGTAYSASKVAEILTGLGLEIESTRAVGAHLSDMQLVELRQVSAHPTREQLKVVEVFDGHTLQTVVCGAPNLPAPGKVLVWAPVGATLANGKVIEARTIAGVASNGMLCSESELGVGDDHSGLLIFDASEAKAGQPLLEAFGLGDSIFEVNVTPNRPDCLGHVGLARELTLYAQKSFHYPPVTKPHQRSAAPIASELSVDIQDKERCPRYTATLVRDVTIKPSSFLTRYRLFTLNVRAINNVVDVTNIIWLLYGHPIHAFDLDTLKGRKIVVRRAKANETLHTLDGMERKLSTDDLLICDAERPIALAGVMGGKNTEITPQTKNVAIECAYFQGQGVRRTAKRTGLHTDASHRYERGVDYANHLHVASDAAARISRVATGTALDGALDLYPKAIPAKSITLRPAQAERLIGIPFTASEIKRTLVGIGAQIKKQTQHALVVEVPSFRPDLTREADLVEELARVKGYDAIPDLLPSIRASHEPGEKLAGYARTLRQTVSTLGFDEAINYSFISPDHAKALAPKESTIALSNPLSQERSVLRTSLLAGLIANAQRAFRRQIEHARIFEVGHVFAPATAPDRLPSEHAELGMCMMGAFREWLGKPRTVDFFDIKGVVDAVIMRHANATPTYADLAELAELAPYLHPRERAVIQVEGRRVGVIGALHPDVTTYFDIPPSYYASLNIEALLKIKAASSLARPSIVVQRFPSAARDAALVVDERVRAGDVIQCVDELSEALIEHIEVFDVYRGVPVPEGSKSLAFRLVYRDNDATLTDEQVDNLHKRVVDHVARNFAASLR